MGESGIFRPGERVELLDGEVVQMSPIGAAHMAAVVRATRAFTRKTPDDVFVSVQNPIRLDDGSEPEPDLVLLKRLPDGRSLPTAADVVLVVEVADASASFDRATKLLLYSRAGVPETWLLVLARAGGTPGSTSTEPALEVYRKPDPNGYTEIRILRRGEKIAPAALPGVEIAVDDLLPEADSDEQAESE
jgi:Uma2 family endonuclease